ncbi:MAG: Mrp/NBP35 family ATP-binding protein [Lentisphaeria bacterium]
MSEKKTESCPDNCAGNCETCSQQQKKQRQMEQQENIQLKECLDHIKHKIVVISGKGGVGKSTVSVNLALSLAMEGKKVGILDIDIHGPSVPKMLQAEDYKLVGQAEKMLPIEVAGLKLMSIGFVLKSPDDAVIWRGPMKMNVIKQFLADVAWGELDYLIVDAPPGTGDEPLTICQLLTGEVGAVIVTTPQAVAASDVSKSLNFCEQLKIRVIGIVENMSGFICPKCGTLTNIFSTGAGEELAKKYNVPLLGKIPIDPVICQSGDAGTPFVSAFKNSTSAKAFAKVIEPILEQE